MGRVGVGPSGLNVLLLCMYPECESYAQALISAGLQVTEVDNASDALAVLDSEFGTDLLVVDLDIPGTGAVVARAAVLDKPRTVLLMGSGCSLPSYDHLVVPGPVADHRYRLSSAPWPSALYR